MIDIQSGEIITRVDKRGIRIKKKKNQSFLMTTRELDVEEKNKYLNPKGLGGQNCNIILYVFTHAYYIIYYTMLCRV